jgi:hypothetical protein
MIFSKESTNSYAYLIFPKFRILRIHYFRSNFSNRINSGNRSAYPKIYHIPNPHLILILIHRPFDIGILLQILDYGEFIGISLKYPVLLACNNYLL